MLPLIGLKMGGDPHTFPPCRTLPITYKHGGVDIAAALGAACLLLEERDIEDGTLCLHS